MDSGDTVPRILNLCH